MLLQIIALKFHTKVQKQVVDLSYYSLPIKISFNLMVQTSNNIWNASQQ